LPLPSREGEREDGRAQERVDKGNNKKMKKVRFIDLSQGTGLGHPLNSLSTMKKTIDSL
jgi:hypothetical protein